MAGLHARSYLVTSSDLGLFWLNQVLIILVFILFFLLLSIRACLIAVRVVVIFFIVLAIRLVWLPVGEKLLLKVEHPWMLEHLDQRDSLVWIFSEELVDQVFVLFGHVALKGDCLPHLVASDCSLVACEWSFAMNKFIEEDSKGPDIKHVVMLPVVDHLGRHILESTAKSVPLSLVHLSLFISLKVAFTSPAEVTNFQYVVLANQ